jgi:hypothetical protein
MLTICNWVSDNCTEFVAEELSAACHADELAFAVLPPSALAVK